MSFINVAPDTVGSSAARLAGVGTVLGEAQSVAADSTTAIAAAAQDQVSVTMAAVFNSYAQHYQSLSTQMAAFHNEFVAALRGAGNLYGTVEAANTNPLQTVGDTVLAAVNAPAKPLMGRALTGDGLTAPRAPAATTTVARMAP